MSVGTVGEFKKWSVYIFPELINITKKKKIFPKPTIKNILIYISEHFSKSIEFNLPLKKKDERRQSRCFLFCKLLHVVSPAPVSLANETCWSLEDPP